MNRRSLLQGAGGMLAAPLLGSSRQASAAGPALGLATRRRRPGDPGWPSAARWEELNQLVGGQLIKVPAPLAPCQGAPDSQECRNIVKELRNPYYLGDQVGLTQTSGWVDAWVSAPSVYAVAARQTQDVVAAVNFARENNLRLVVKGGGHSYQGTSNAADSLLVWTRPMRDVVLHDGFVAQGCGAHQPAQPAVSVGAGAIWRDVYDAVVTRNGRYVQGGGCVTVGVAGLVQSGGFGSFSKNFGLAAGKLLEAEIVTADGTVRIANACINPDLFWALKGGGGGSFGVVTRTTLRTDELPDFFGIVTGAVRARSDAAYRQLLSRFVAFYAERLFNPHWGETATFRPDNVLAVAMTFQGLDQPQAESIWRSFFDWVAGSPQDFAVVDPPRILAAPARHLWDAAFLLRNVPGAVVSDDRPGAPVGNVFWAGDRGQVGQFLHGYASVWLPESLLAPDQQARLCDGVFASSRHWPVSLHFNKGLAGAPSEAIAAARDTAVHPSVQDAFALAITAGEGPPAFPGMPGDQPDLPVARRHAAEIAAAARELRNLAPETGSYVAEASFFEEDWQKAHWGSNYERLLSVKKTFDPAGLFFVHHGVGSEEWSADGFTRLT